MLCINWVVYDEIFATFEMYSLFFFQWLTIGNCPFFATRMVQLLYRISQ